MPNQPNVTLENNFIGGLKTEFTGLNFPENSCTDADNVTFDLIGNVSRRLGIDFEVGARTAVVSDPNKATSTYKWLNAGGSGSIELLVVQSGKYLYFYQSSSASETEPLSGQRISSIVDLTTFLPTGSGTDPSPFECTYSSGNGYLFVYHLGLSPFYCSYDAGAGTITAKVIQVQIRDFAGIPESGTQVNTRPTTLTTEHTYNLLNQGWTNSPTWSASSTTSNVLNTSLSQYVSFQLGNLSFTVPSSLTIDTGTPVNITGNFTFNIINGGQGNAPLSCTGTVVSYSGTTLVINVSGTSTYTSVSPNVGTIAECSWTISASNLIDLINTWNSGIGSYPSNADVWWRYKDSSDTFSPSTTINNVTQSINPAPQGHFVIDAFDQERSYVSGVAGLTPIKTFSRPKIGAWFQGRVWYAGADASQAASGDAAYYTWTENLYFSQIITDSTQFGMCYQTNDPTDQNLFDELPSDGGVISIQGCGQIYKLFPIQNGMLVFASLGIWFITGSQGIGFTATDFTITKISGVRSISSTSFVDVNGLPIFWNEEGIYSVEPTKQGAGLNVNPITVGTILRFYTNIPTISKLYARGDYNPIDYTIQWVYRSTSESSVTDRYYYDRILILNTYTKSFYTYSIAGTPKIAGIVYMTAVPGIVTNPPASAFKYLTYYPGFYTFSDEHLTTYVDWSSYQTENDNFDSYFITGYKLHGQALRKWQPEYVYMYSNGPQAAYKIQALWDYANTGNSGKFSATQAVNVYNPNFDVIVRRHRLRGRGTSLQIKVSSVDGLPFDVFGWAIFENINTGI